MDEWAIRGRNGERPGWPQCWPGQRVLKILMFFRVLKGRMTRLVVDFENNRQSLETDWMRPIVEREVVMKPLGAGFQRGSGDQGGHGSSEPHRPWGTGYTQKRWGISGVRGSLGGA